MPLKFFHRPSRPVLIGLEILAALAGVILLVTGLAVWRLSAGPVDLAFAKDHIESALHDPVSGYSVKFERVVLEWPDFKGPLLLDLKGIDLVRDGRTAVEVERAMLGLSGLYLVAGRVMPVSIILDQPVLHLVRTADNKVRLSVSDEESDITSADIPAARDQNPVMAIVDDLSRPAEEMKSGSLLGQLQSLEIRKASAIVEDHVAGLTWHMKDLDLLFGRADSGLALRAGMQFPGGRDGAATVQAEAAYDREGGLFSVDVYLQDLDVRALSHKIAALSFLDYHEIFLNGTVSFVIDRDMALQKAALAVSAERGWLSFPELYDAPLPYQEMAVDGAYDRAAGKAEIKNLSLKVQDVSFEVKSAASVSDDKIFAPVTLKVPALPQEKIAALWPQALDDVNAKKWLVERLSKGSIDGVEVSFDVASSKKESQWETAVENIAASFSVTNMDVDYRAPLMPAKDVHAKGVYKNDTLDIAIEKAAVGDLAVSNGKVVIDKIIGEGVGEAKITLGLSGPVAGIVKYIESEPIAVKAADIGLSPEAIKGAVALDVAVSFPTLAELPAEKVTVSAKGTVSDVVLPDVIKDMDLTGGPLQLKLGEGLVSLSGNAMLEGRPVALSWQQYLDSKDKSYSAKTEAKLDVDPDLRRRLGVDIAEWVEGTLPANITYTELSGGRATVDIDANATPAHLMVAPFAYQKAPGAEAAVKCSVSLQNGILQEIQNLEVQSSDLRISGGRFVFEQRRGESALRRATIPRAVIGESDIALEVESPADGLMKVGVKGSFLDARPFLDKKKEEAGPRDEPRLIASVDVGRMRTKDGRLVEKAKAYLDIGRDGLPRQVELDAIAGNGAIYMRLKPDESGKLALRLEADDAGAALRAFDVYDNVRGGKLRVNGVAADPKRPHRLSGTAQLDNFKVVNAPALAQLVGAIGLAGLPQLLSGEGLSFARLESKFDWSIRRAGDIYVLNDGRTSGSSLGLTFEGTINKEKNEMAVKGHVIPVSEINTMIASIPLIGSVLSGGTGDAIFAATYDVKGAADKPVVSVNPLSVLTPGIIRRILFED